jgi:hypothetical protein
VSGFEAWLAEGEAPGMIFCNGCVATVIVDELMNKWYPEYAKRICLCLG